MPERSPFVCEVLIVEDDDDSRMLAEELLAYHGFRVRSARDGVEALELLQSGYRPHAAVVDLMMPRMDGVTLVQHIVEMPHASGIIIVVLSAAPQLAAPLLPHLTAVLRKPFEFEDLAHLLRHACARLNASS